MVSSSSLPLPAGMPTDEIIAQIDPKKDTDGFHEETLKRFLGGDATACPVFPRAIVELIRETGIAFHGEKAIAVVNSSGGIGIRARLKIASRKGWEFKSPLRHQ
jgi:methylenetetrahydrofolate dehydrogenase (NADP+)/methenyltetrahydrofolate cyclohydrolase